MLLGTLSHQQVPILKVDALSHGNGTDSLDNKCSTISENDRRQCSQRLHGWRSFQCSSYLIRCHAGWSLMRCEVKNVQAAYPFMNVLTTTTTIWCLVTRIIRGISSPWHSKYYYAFLFEECENLLQPPCCIPSPLNSILGIIWWMSNPLRGCV